MKKHLDKIFETLEIIEAKTKSNEVYKLITNLHDELFKFNQDFILRNSLESMLSDAYQKNIKLNNLDILGIEKEIIYTSDWVAHLFVEISEDTNFNDVNKTSYFFDEINRLNNHINKVEITINRLDEYFSEFGASEFDSNWEFEDIVDFINDKYLKSENELENQKLQLARNKAKTLSVDEKKEVIAKHNNPNNQKSLTDLIIEHNQKGKNVQKELLKNQEEREH